MQVNPIGLVKIRGASKRKRQPRSLTVEQFRLLVIHLRKPFGTMALVCICANRFRSFGIKRLERCTMPDIKKDSTSSPQQPSNKRRSEEAAVNERLEKDADEMAGEAQKVEKKYDQEHDIFTK